MNLRATLQSTLILALLLTAAHARTRNPSLQIYFIDVEGGQATLIVSPSGQSLLIDTGWSDAKGRDADRIVSAAHAAHIKKIDYVLITHFHRDHVGGVPQLVERIKVGTFIDHGPNQENSDVTREDYAAYQKAIAGHPHIVATPGMGIPIKALEVEVLTAAGDQIKDPLPGQGTANPNCGQDPTPLDDATENPRSLGVMIRYGNFRFLDLGDLTKNKELDLVCPNNLIGTADLFLVNHHGFDQSNTKALVWAVHPRVAIFDNGAHKGASASVLQTVHDSPGIEAIWQLHYAVDAPKELNVSLERIANVEEKEPKDEGKSIRVEAATDGTFIVTNTRNNYQQTHEKK
jgi:competence protein ComEC